MAQSVEHSVVSTPGQAPLLPAGWIRIDCHLHTVRSGDACTKLDELEERVESTGLDVVCITDHHAIDGAEEALRRDFGIRVIVGEEIRTPIGELIGLFLQERIPYVLPVEEVVGRIRRQGGLVYVPHPYDPVRAGVRDIPLKQLCEERAVDVIEAFNSKTESDVHNQEAWRTAQLYDLPVAAGSDAHDPPGIGAAWVQMPDFDGPGSFLSSLEQATIVGEYRPHALRFAPRTSDNRVGGLRWSALST
jgi:predicted metal-dependent phosphoesterase TrpH